MDDTEIESRRGRDTVPIVEVAQRLGISRQGVYDAIRRHELPVLKIGRRLFILRAQFEAMISGAR
jgi:excisionase family DNA binding protein